MSRAIKLLSPSQLKSLAPRATVVLDASWHMPGSPLIGKEEYLKSRVPLSRFWDVDEIAASSPLGLKHMIPSAEQFASSASALGISRESHVVVYDSAGLFSSPRTAFTFASFGHENVSVLDGGFPRWKSEGFEVEHGAPPAFESGFYPTPEGEAKSTLSYDDVVANISARSSAVLDARPKPRFTAEAPEPRAGLPSGHIPGSRSLPFSELVQDGQLKSDDELRHVIHQRLGPDADAVFSGKKPVFASCGSGMTAAVIWLALNRLGVDARIYDESWTGYAGRAESEIATGEE